MFSIDCVWLLIASNATKWCQSTCNSCGIHSEAMLNKHNSKIIKMCRSWVSLKYCILFHSARINIVRRRSNMEPHILSVHRPIAVMSIIGTMYLAIFRRLPFTARRASTMSIVMIVLNRWLIGQFIRKLLFMVNHHRISRDHPARSQAKTNIIHTDDRRRRHHHHQRHNRQTNI